MTIGPQKLGPYWLIGATTFSRIGTLAYTVVMTWAVSKAGGNNSVGWVNAAAGFTIVLVGISATTWLDKFDKRTLLLLLDASAAVVCLAAAAVLLLVPMSSVVFTGVVVAVITSAVASLYSPASRALIPSMVPTEGLERYNSVYTGFSETSRAAGPGLGALLLAVGGSEAFPLSLIINSISFIISFLLTLPLPAAPPRQANEHEQKEHAFFQSVRVITKHSILRGEVLGALSINFLLPNNTFILLHRIGDRRKSIHVRACEFFRSGRGDYRSTHRRNHRGTTAAYPCKPTHGTNCPGLAFMPYRWDMGNHYLADDRHRTRDGLQHHSLQPATTRNPERKDGQCHCGRHHELCSRDATRESSFLQNLHHHTHAHAHLGHKHHPPSGGVGDNDWQPKTRTIGLNEAQLLGKHAPAQR